MSGVFTKYDVHLFQNPQSPEADILQISDWRGDDI